MKLAFEARVVSAFCISYLLALSYCRLAFTRDPTSFFFGPVEGYKRRYSLRRQHEAEAFISAAQPISSSSVVAANGTSGDPLACVGIATVDRPGGHEYVRGAIGSLLHGLDGQERRSLRLILFIAHTDPRDHPVYHEQWARSLVDDILTYEVTEEQMLNLEQWEAEKQYADKGVFDYTYLLQKCLDTGAPRIVMLEDDVIAVQGWYAKMLDAADYADEETDPKRTPGWLYLRLFYTEEFLGWNVEEWPKYLVGSMVTLLLVWTILIAARRRSLYLQINMSNRMVFVTCSACVSASIMLYFLAGRCSMQPLPTGIIEMPRYGCCSQGLLFNREKVQKAISYLQARRAGPIDSLIEELANEERYVRWAVSPSLLQHIGRRSSKGDDFGPQSKYSMSVAEKIWSFGFEMTDTTMRRFTGLTFPMSPLDRLQAGDMVSSFHRRHRRRRRPAIPNPTT